MQDTYQCYECEKTLMDQRFFVCEDCQRVEQIAEWERKTIKKWREMQ